MEYGICNLAVIPMRAEPNEQSEMVSQLLFGETFEVIEWVEKWARVITTIDSYTGWISRLQFAAIGHLAYNQLRNDGSPLTYGAVTQAWKRSDNSILYLPEGSSLVFFEGASCKIGKEKFEIIGPKGDIESFFNTAKSYLNTPYLWGGRTHFGIDCSGYVQCVYRLHGIILKRDASLQAEQGVLINDIEKLKPGDLAFFHNNDNKVVHVGILLNSGQIIHASGKVKIDSFDEMGIYSEDLKRYTHKLHSVRRHSKLVV